MWRQCDIRIDKNTDEQSKPCDEKMKLRAERIEKVCSHLIMNDEKFSNFLRTLAPNLRNFWIFTNRTRSNDLKGNPTLLYWATRKSQISKGEKLNIPMNFKIHEGTESTDYDTVFF